MNTLLSLFLSFAGLLSTPAVPVLPAVPNGVPLPQSVSIPVPKYDTVTVNPVVVPVVTPLPAIQEPIPAVFQAPLTDVVASLPAPLNTATSVVPVPVNVLPPVNVLVPQVNTVLVPLPTVPGLP